MKDVDDLMPSRSTIYIYIYIYIYYFRFLIIHTTSSQELLFIISRYSLLYRYSSDPYKVSRLILDRRRSRFNDRKLILLSIRLNRSYYMCTIVKTKKTWLIKWWFFNIRYWKGFFLYGPLIFLLLTLVTHLSLKALSVTQQRPSSPKDWFFTGHNTCVPHQITTAEFRGSSSFIRAVDTEPNDFFRPFFELLFWISAEHPYSDKDRFKVQRIHIRCTFLPHCAVFSPSISKYFFCFVCFFSAPIQIAGTKFTKRSMTQNTRKHRYVLQTRNCRKRQGSTNNSSTRTSMQSLVMERKVKWHSCKSLHAGGEQLFSNWNPQTTKTQESQLFKSFPFKKQEQTHASRRFQECSRCCVIWWLVRSLPVYRLQCASWPVY